MGVQAQGVVGDLKPFGLGHRLLAGFNFRVVKLFDPTTVQANHVVVVLSFVELVDSFAAFKMVAMQNARLLKLGQHPVHRGQPDVGSVVQQVPEHIFGRHVALHATLKNLQDFQARDGGFEASALEVVDVHGAMDPGGEQGGCGAASWPLQCPDDIGQPGTMTASSTIRLPIAAFVLALVAGLSGCGITQGVNKDTFKPYIPDVVQGNFVSREQRQLLRLGMTRAQVRDVLGTPLVASVFHADRWDYAFSIRRQGVAAQQFHLAVHFNNDVLARIESDELPSEVEFVQRLTLPAPAGKIPALEATQEQLSKFPSATTTPVAPAPQAPLPATYPPLDSAPR
jgi:outer membrane protein assembly factor BamE